MRRLIFAGVTAFSLACSDATGPPSVLGTYRLRTVNGQPLPWVSFNNGIYKTESFFSYIQLEDGNRFRSVLAERVYLNNVLQLAVKVDSSSGKWILSGSSITLSCESADCNVPGTGLIGEAAMTFTSGGDVFVFRK